MTLYKVHGGRIMELDEGSEASPFMAVGSEYKGWLEYTELAKSHPSDSRYKVAAADEFKHMLIRLADALTAVKGMASADEQTALASFLKEMSA